MNIQQEFEVWARSGTPFCHVFSLARTWDHPNGERYIEFATELAFQAYKARDLQSKRDTKTLERELCIARTLLEKFRTRLGESKPQIGDRSLAVETDFFLTHCKPDQDPASKYEFQASDDFFSREDDTMHTATINIKENGETHWSAIAVHGAGMTQAVARRDYVLRVLQSQAQQPTEESVNKLRDLADQCKVAASCLTYNGARAEAVAKHLLLEASQGLRRSQAQQEPLKVSENWRDPLGADAMQRLKNLGLLDKSPAPEGGKE